MFEESVFKEVFYQSRIPQFIMTLNQHKIMYNPAFMHFMGYTEKEWISKPIEEFSHPEDSLINFQYFEQVIKGDCLEYQMEKRFISRDGQIRTGDLHVSLIKEGETPYLLGQVIDITEKKVMEETTQESERKYRLLAEYSSDIINLHEPDGTYLYLSPSIESTLGYEPSSLIGVHPNEIIHPEDIPMIEEKFNSIYQENQAVLITYRARNTSGEYLWFESVLKAILNKETNEIANIVSVSRDIEARLEAEEHLKRSDKLAVLGQMAAAVAHEIRNPLTPIKGFLQLCSDKKQYNENYLDIVITEINRMEDIITDFLHLAKPQESSNEIVNINNLISEVITLVGAQIKEKSGSYYISSESQSFLIRGNENDLKQVFLNILQNAIDAIEVGGSITVTVGKVSDYLRISIKDNGIGIPCEILPHLGEPFYSTKEKGTGLGLLISNKIIENHGGKITFRSEKGIGTEVQIFFPINESP
ncbi:PAS domain-containing sensor histidine kinase [Rossellomorea aquimaris]|uniref:PAS domain-containing sensor histidine kinase n=1 Tax=Rossellomorea aquimaris TaxID=189382 RepID=UPI0007D0B0CF|nr:PAS domain-containing sensor histidine kinase [Rossellomorea aquimaris]